ncbi:carboxypeptidase-like regulatory domain-containing protein [Aeromicrobium fastidiosum]|nr:carboxypeptidase-like regulatory domain-containing protein [Aeromicrobium fastidiosum]MBP2390042.1 hypothetical protein [Aeromicrobium fastidiosum]
MLVRAMRLMVAGVTSAVLMAGMSSAATADDGPQTGTISGVITDRSGYPVSNVLVLAESTEDESIRGSSHTDESGRYTMDVQPDDVLLLAKRESFDDLYLGGRDAASARVITVTAGATVSGADAALTGQTPRSLAPGAGMGGQFDRLGQVAQGGAGEWVDSTGRWISPNRMTFVYQWFRMDGSTPTPITGATSRTYRSSVADLGHFLKIGVTASYSGSSTVYVEGMSRTVVKRSGKVSILSAKSTKKRVIRLKVKVKALVGPTPTGQVRAFCRLTYRGTGQSKKISLKNGIATITLRTNNRTSSKSKYATCVVEYLGDGLTLRQPSLESKRLRMKLK